MGRHGERATTGSLVVGGVPREPLAPDPSSPSSMLGRAWLLFRASHPEPTAAVTAMATAYAWARGRGARGCLAVGLAVGAGQLSVGWQNDWRDAARDERAARADKPVARGMLEVATVRRAATAAGAAALPLSLASGRRAAAAHAVALGAAWCYNLGLKATPASFVPYALAFPLLAVFVEGGGTAPTRPPAWLLGGVSLIGVGAHLANATPDIPADLAEGIRGLPQRLGREWSLRAATILVSAASGLLALGPGRPGKGRIAALLAVPVLAGLGLRAPGAESRAPFRAVMAVAALDVGLLVTAGRRRRRWVER